MDRQSLPIIDWNQGIRLAGNNRQLAKEILELFLKNVQDEINQINEVFAQQQYDDLYKKIHKLHGAVCYCGLPRVKRLMEKLETDLKNHIMDNLPSHLNQLNTEVHLLFKHYSPDLTA